MSTPPNGGRPAGGRAGTPGHRRGDPTSDEWVQYYRQLEEQVNRMDLRARPDAEVARRIELEGTAMSTLFVVVAVIGAILYLLVR